MINNDLSYPNAVRKFNTISTVAIAVTILALSVAALAALVFVPPVGLAVGASLVVTGVTTLKIAAVVAVAMGSAALCSSIIAAILKNFKRVERPTPSYNLSPEIVQVELNPIFLRLLPRNFIPPAQAADVNPRFVCPIMHDQMEDPAYLIENFLTFDRDSIESNIQFQTRGGHWNNPFTCPVTRVTYLSSTLIPNYSLYENEPRCPITGEAFACAYICLETGYSYEFNAICNLSPEERNRLINENRTGDQVLTRITLAPNFVLCSSTDEDNIRRNRLRPISLPLVNY